MTYYTNQAIGGVPKGEELYLDMGCNIPNGAYRGTVVVNSPTLDEWRKA